LQAALREKSVRRFTRVERDTWNDVAVRLDWAPPPYDAGHGLVVYVASAKSRAEKEEVWKFAAERSPQLGVNGRQPAAIIGEPLDVKHVESKSA
jgi:hypothetical protein